MTAFRIICFILASAFSIRAYSQHSSAESCSFSVLHQKKLSEDSIYRNKFKETELQSYNFQNSKLNNHYAAKLLKTAGTYTIPVVVHIIHNNGPENISDQQVLAGIKHLNDAYAALPPYNGSGGTNMGISFCLAQTDPSGNYTSGINRVASSLTNVESTTQDLSLKNLIRWDPTQYLNIWLVKEICANGNCAVAGYAYFAAAHGQPYDGIVSEAAFFGSSTDNSKVHIHESGHYLNLYHTFESGCQNDNCLLSGDHICDTPPDNSTAPVFPCQSFINSCQTDSDDPSTNNPFRPASAGGSGDQNDLFKNFMDYGYQECQDLFTPGQKDRMQASLLGPRASLLQSDVCSFPCSSPISIAFTSSATNILAGSSVNFNNTTSGATGFKWKLNGNLFSTAANPSYTFTNTGIYIVQLVADNPDISCTKSSTDTIYVTCIAEASFTTGAYSVSPGQSVSFTNTSTGAVSYQWLVDNNPAGTSTDLTYVFPQPGNYAVGLIALNGSCSDTSTYVTIRVKDCSVAARGKQWYFGDHCGLDFSNGLPVPLTDGNMFAGEGNAIAFDNQGDILFYSNGDSVYNRNHTLMLNGAGLLGGRSSTQGSLAIPYPANPGKYILFTSDEAENYCVNGYRYHVIDMSLNGGLGAVTSEKNILLFAPNAEKLTATYHANGEDIWVMTRDYYLNTFLSYPVTKNGVGNPVSTSIGATGTNPQELGAMKFSHDGKKLANVFVEAPRFLEIFDFNKSTGVLSNLITVPTNEFSQPYGVEFSPDDSRLYLSCVLGGPTTLFQINMNAGSPSAIINSLSPLSNLGNPWGFTGMQLGPDDKIYVSGTLQPQISVINQPNLLGPACDFNSYTIDVGNYANWSIPNLFEKKSPVKLTIAGPDTVCPQQSTLYSIGNKNKLNFSGYTTGGGDVSVVNDSTISITFVSGGNDTIFVLDATSCVNSSF
ncbi:MAG: M43 family zinc metalloprotease, partial [Cytophagaceae bacterium]